MTTSNITIKIVCYSILTFCIIQTGIGAYNAASDLIKPALINLDIKKAP